MRLGEIYRQLGEPEKAVHDYNRIVGLWEDCDPELRPMVGARKLRL